MHILFISITVFFLIFCISCNFIVIGDDWKNKFTYFITDSWFKKLSNALTNRYLVHSFIILEILAHSIITKLGLDIPRREMYIAGVPSLLWAISQKIRFLCWLLIRDRKIGLARNIWNILSEEDNK